MERFCDDLRWEREHRGVSLEAISGVTKISQRHLAALESGDYASLPGGVFRKGILRGYLSTLGLDPDPWVRRFDECLAAFERPLDSPEQLAAFAENVRRSRGLGPSHEPTRWPGVFFMVVVLVAFGWCVWRFALRGHVVLSQVRPAPVRAVAPGRAPAS